ncbi:hypothetical protein GCM10007363_30900 [Pseudomonas fluvialis]|uniref:Uncharacterized protein n=3 Tax=Pseudomonas fluvialis TaxID=1793966 RepID=A0ABQ2ATR8_9PSED|nr:hypothetical protein GCM10007363_30900 [Pseudomonas fluvialis]
MPGEVRVEHRGLGYSYIEPNGGTFKVANAKPQDLSGLLTDTDKALSVFGFPSMKIYPPNSFTFDMARFAYTADDVAPYQTRHNDALKADKGIGAADTAITAGLAGDMSPAAAIGLAVVLGGGSVRTEDPRIIMSNLLCFKPVGKMDAKEALRSCWDDFNANVSSAFDTWEPTSTAIWRHTHSIRIGNTGRARISMNRKLADYGKGFAPVERGGYSAHIFKFAVRINPMLDSPYKVDDLAAMLDKTKADSLVYLISAKADPREQVGLEPIGLY